MKIKQRKPEADGKIDFFDTYSNSPFPYPLLTCNVARQLNKHPQQQYKIIKQTVRKERRKTIETTNRKQEEKVDETEKFNRSLVHSQ